MPDAKAVSVPQSAMMSATGSSSTSTAIMVLFCGFMWALWGISVTNEMALAGGTLLTALIHTMSKCIWCKKLVGVEPDNATITLPVAVPATAAPGSPPTVAKETLS